MENNNSNLEFRKIKSLKFLYEINSNGTIIRNVKSKKQLKIHLDFHHSKAGYYKVFICIGGRKNRKVYHRTIHSLVAECWLGDKPEGLEIDHIDRNSHNNDYRNLRYVNHSEQMKNRVLSERIINQCKENCRKYNMKKGKKVIVKDFSEEHNFDSMTKASEWLALKYNTKTEHIKSKMKKRRSHIYDYDIIYLNAETRHADSTE